jgi:hypothetical protein
MMKIHTLLPAMLLIAGTGLSSDVFDMEPSFILPSSGCKLFSSVLLNNDSIPDLIMGNHSADFIKVLYGTGDGSFNPGEDYSISWPLWIESGDMDNDGDVDAVVRFTPPSPDSFAVYLNNGYGVFSDIIKSEGPGKSNTGSFSIMDFNSDGFLDIITACGNSEVYVLIGNGDGTFNPQMIFNESLQPLALACGDVDNDDDIDIVLLCMVTNGYGMISVLLNNGDGTVTWNGHYGNYWTEGSEASIAIGDLNNDSNPDVVCCPGGSYPPIKTVYTLLGAGDGSFVQTGPGWFDLGVFYMQTDINDYNLDGNMDAFFSGGCGVLLMLGCGNGQLEIDYFNGDDVTCDEAGLGDFDMDGDIDYLQSVGNSMQVFLNKTIQLGIEEEESAAHVSLDVASNPVADNATICFSLSEPSPCILNVYDIHGRMVSQICNGFFSDGNHHVIWNSSDQPAGCYTLVLDTRLGQSNLRCVKTY